MLKRSFPHPRRGIIGVEVAISLVLLFLIAALTLDAIVQYRHTSDEYFWRRAALWAADAQLQRYGAGASLDSAPPAGLMPDRITLTTRREPGSGQWQGFDRITVKATTTMPAGRVAHEQLSAYLPAEGHR